MQIYPIIYKLYKFICTVFFPQIITNQLKNGRWLNVILKANRLNSQTSQKKDQRICVFHYFSRNISCNSTRARRKRDSRTWEIWVKCKVYEPNQRLCLHPNFLLSSFRYSLRDMFAWSIRLRADYDMQNFHQYESNSLSPLLLLFCCTNDKAKWHED